MRRRLGAWLVRRAERARHNDHDFACRYWWGDRRPDTEDRTNHDFGGDATRLDLRRCLVCRPHSRTEADALIERDPIDDEAASDLPS
ncbi:hypothetical protein [Nocardioides pakistanensis]